jgi:hypothetical protein
VVPALEMSGVAVSTSSHEIGPREATVTGRARREAGVGKKRTDRDPRFLFTGVVSNAGLAGLVPGDLPSWSDAIKILATDASPRVCSSRQAMVRVKVGSRLAIPDEMIDACQKLRDNTTSCANPVDVVAAGRDSS